MDVVWKEWRPLKSIASGHGIFEIQEGTLYSVAVFQRILGRMMNNFRRISIGKRFKEFGTGVVVYIYGIIKVDRH